MESAETFRREREELLDERRRVTGAIDALKACGLCDLAELLTPLVDALERRLRVQSALVRAHETLDSDRSESDKKDAQATRARPIER